MPTFDFGSNRIGTQKNLTVLFETTEPGYDIGLGLEFNIKINGTALVFE
jgi:hypothetical protein